MCFCLQDKVQMCTVSFSNISSRRLHPAKLEVFFYNNFTLYLLYTEALNWLLRRPLFRVGVISTSLSLSAHSVVCSDDFRQMESIYIRKHCPSLNNAVTAEPLLLGYTSTKIVFKLCMSRSLQTFPLSKIRKEFENYVSFYSLLRMPNHTFVYS